jgi:hypothetical protein
MAGKKGRSERMPPRTADFAGDGEPYTEVEVKISIRILGSEITRSRLGVNVYPDPALQEIATNSLRAMNKENYGFNPDGVFGACLSENFSGWEDMNHGFPKISEDEDNPFRQRDAERMNKYVAESVEWALSLHKLGMEQARRKEGSDRGRTPPRVM